MSTFGTFKFILMLIIFFFYLSNILNTGLSLVTKYFYCVQCTRETL